MRVPICVWNYDPISRGLKLGLDSLQCLLPVWNYDPISRGLKPYGVAHYAVTLFCVWNYDPISRGLKLRAAEMGLEL